MMMMMMVVIMIKTILMKTPGCLLFCLCSHPTKIQLINKTNIRSSLYLHLCKLYPFWLISTHLNFCSRYFFYQLPWIMLSPLFQSDPVICIPGGIQPLDFVFLYTEIWLTSPPPHSEQDFDSICFWIWWFISWEDGSSDLGKES